MTSLSRIGEHVDQIDQSVTVTDTPDTTQATCPVVHAAAAAPHDGIGQPVWWPNQLNLKILAKNPAVANPLGEDFDYKAAFEALDLAAVKQDIEEVAHHLAGLVARGLRPLRSRSPSAWRGTPPAPTASRTVAAAAAPVSSASRR